MCLSSDKYINSRNLFFNKEDDNVYIIPVPSGKPVKLVIEDNVKITSNGNVIEVKKHLSSMEAEKLLNDIFGTTDIGVLDCGDMSDEEIDDIIEKFNSIPEEYPIVSEDLRKVLERTEKGV